MADLGHSCSSSFRNSTAQSWRISRTTTSGTFWWVVRRQPQARAFRTDAQSVTASSEEDSCCRRGERLQPPPEQRRYCASGGRSRMEESLGNSSPPIWISLANLQPPRQVHFHMVRATLGEELDFYSSTNLFATRSPSPTNRRVLALAGPRSRLTWTSSRPYTSASRPRCRAVRRLAVSRNSIVCAATDHVFLILSTPGHQPHVPPSQSKGRSTNDKLKFVNLHHLPTSRPRAYWSRC